jgi:Rv0078B-related antitoxin
LAEKNNRTGIFTTINGERREIVIELLDPKQGEIYRSWTPAQRLRAAADLCRFARQLMRNQIQSLNPEWSPEQVEREVARRTLGNAI